MVEGTYDINHRDEYNLLASKTVSTLVIIRFIDVNLL